MENREPLVSIIVLSYQNGLFIEECLNSIVNQTYRNLQINIVDDGSTDSTESIIRLYLEKDDRIKYFPQPYNRGISVNFNTGIEVCTGDYICVFASDDAMYPTKIEKQVAFLESHHDYVICNHNIDVFDSDKKQILHTWSDKYDFTESAEDAIFTANWFFKKRVKRTPSGSWFARASYWKNGRNDSRTSSAHELLLMLGMCVASPKAKWYTLQEPLGFYRIHGNNLSRATKPFQTSIEEIIVSYELAKIRYPHLERKLNNELAFWFFKQLLYNSVPKEQYKMYLKIYFKRFGLIKWIYLFAAKAILKLNVGSIFHVISNRI